MRTTGLAIVILLGTNPAAWAADVLHSDGRYTQTASGMTFPRVVDDFRRGRIVRFLRDGTDESVDFNRTTPMSEIAATVNVYPAALGWTERSDVRSVDPCKWQFQQVKHGITVVHQDAALIEEAATKLIQNDRTYSGYRAKYRLTDTHFFDGSGIAAREDVFMFCNAGKWTVQYTFDYRASYDASGAIARFMHDLPLTIRDSSI